jgi:hypothetical protein
MRFLQSAHRVRRGNEESNGEQSGNNDIALSVFDNKRDCDYVKQVAAIKMAN